MIMKKLVSMTMAMAMMAALFVACGDDGTDDETPPPRCSDYRIGRR